jgi:putative DNA primase/helicase
MDVDIFKRLVSGEPVAARERYKTSFDLENNCKFIFNANKLPRVGELTEAYFRRFLIIPYNQFISDEEKDPELHLKIIENELPGVLNWAIEGLNRLLQKKQFSYSKVVEESIMEYKKESNSIIHFIDESSLKMSLTNRIPISSLFDKYMQFCRFNDLKSFTKIDFSKTLKSLNFDDYRTSKERGFYAIFEN